MTIGLLYNIKLVFASPKLFSHSLLLSRLVSLMSSYENVTVRPRPSAIFDLT